MTRDPFDDLLASEHAEKAAENEPHPVVFQRLASFRTARCTGEILAFVEAMTHEMEDNAHKGHWMTDRLYNKDGSVANEWNRAPAEFLSDLMYHFLKLVLAVRSGDEASVLEYVADVGNCAWFVADFFGLLSVPIEHMHRGPIEYMSERMPGVTPEQLQTLKKNADTIVRAMLDVPTGKQIHLTYADGPDPDHNHV
jgi:hypothetical protein